MLPSASKTSGARFARGVIFWTKQYFASLVIRSFERAFQTATPRKGLCDTEEVSSVQAGD